MILVWLMVLLLAAGVLSAAAGRWNRALPRWIALAAVSLGLILMIRLWILHMPRLKFAGAPVWLEEMNAVWIPQWGVRFHVGMDGLSLLLVVLTFFSGVVAVLASWTEIRDRAGFFYFNLMWILAGIVGVFVALDLFLFYFVWELMLIPMYFLIALWGHERRNYAAVKFFLFTQFSGLLMLVAILALYFAHGAATGDYTFDYPRLLGTPLGPAAATWIMLGFFVAFAVKLPVFPLHTWLPDAHTEAPTGGSIVLAALLLKTGGYGLIRFVFPLFPEAARDFAPVAMTLAVIGILYGAILAFGQMDLKRLVAYTSVSHLGFVLLGVFAWNEPALQGAVLTMLAHGISTGALFLIAGALQERLHTREMDRMGGIWRVAPRLSSVTMFFAMASIGLPGLGDFIGEFLVLLGAFVVSVPLAVAAAIGVLFATLYGLKLVQRALHGPNAHNLSFPDFSGREMLVTGVMMAVLLWLGLYPQPVFDTFAPALNTLQQQATGAPIASTAPAEITIDGN